PDALAAMIAGELPSEPAARVRVFIETFGARAFRRPLTAVETDRYAALFERGAGHYGGPDPFVDGVRITIEAMLQSPHFVYRVEAGPGTEADPSRLTGYEVAARLSYLLWNTMPDAELFAAAASGQLGSVEGITAQAERMFDDPRTRATFDHFHLQLFEMHEYADIDKDTGVFPEWRREMGAMMLTEMQMFLSSVVFTRQGTVGDLFTATHTYVNQDLAPLYGLEGEFSGEFTEVELDPSTRAGFLTRLGFLTRNATLTEPDPIHRGVFANLNVICRPLAALPNIPDNLMPVGNTNRERIDSITGDGTCGAGCHSTTINPLGFALENYDAIGRYRTEDNGYPVDAAALYVFEDGRAIDFRNGIELSYMLADSPEVHSCYIGSLLEYALSRSVAIADGALVTRLTEESLARGTSIREVFMSVVTSNVFRNRAPTTRADP
ncbi:MAG: DUF1592 domain-containing protein, partial [Myxococcota bacterium]